MSRIPLTAAEPAAAWSVWLTASPCPARQADGAVVSLLRCKRKTVYFLLHTLYLCLSIQHHYYSRIMVILQDMNTVSYEINLLQQY